VRLLILGGTKFLGRATAEAGLARGHELTLFNRGETNPELFPEAEKLRGDRDGDLSALEGREWDAVIDPSGFVPRLVRASAELLRGNVGHYVFVSSISVYRSFSSPQFDERAPVIELDDPTREDFRASPESYGGLKVLCERVVAETFPDGHANIRSGLIVGQHDPTGRFTYWPLRVARGGEILAPGRPARTTQFVDVRDLGEWIVHVVEERVTGTYNATGPRPAVTMAELLAACGRVAGGEPELVWVDDRFLVERGVEEYSELPLWVPETDAEWRYFTDADVSRAISAGLRFRPVDETVGDTLDWARTAEDPLAGAGLAPAREAELLEEWRAAR
jgi:2'-hydroxyisoflavone reductase